MMNFKEKMSNLLEDKYQTIFDDFDSILNKFNTEFEECNDIQQLHDLQMRVESAIQDIQTTVESIENDDRLSKDALNRLNERLEDIHDKYFPG